MKADAEYKILEIDLWEKDAILEIDDMKVYFQFDGMKQPTIVDAIKYLVKEAEKQYACKNRTL